MSSCFVIQYYVKSCHVRYIKKQKINNVLPELVRVRRYAPGDDLETVRGIVNAAYSSKGIINVREDGSRLQRVLAVEDIDTTHLHLATLGHQIVGAVSITPAPDAAHIGPLAVRPDLFGRGLGTLLMEHAETVISATAAPVTRLTCQEAGLATFYTRRGYTMVKEEPLMEVRRGSRTFKTINGLTVKHFEKTNRKGFTPRELQIRKYEIGDDLTTISNIINEAYKKVYDDLCVGRVKRVVSSDEIVTDHLHLAMLGQQIVGAMVVTPAAEAAAVGQPRSSNGW